MALLAINWKPSQKELRQFAAIWFPLACVAMGLLVWRFSNSWGWAAVPVLIGAILAPLAYFIPAISQRLFVGWMLAAYPIGWTVSHVLMAVIYFLLITPMGLLMRLCGRDTMGRQADEARDTYWISHQPPKNNQQYFRQY